MGENVNSSEYILQLKNIVKTFPGVTALSNVSLDVKKGVVHAIMGENGAGKSTLMKCLRLEGSNFRLGGIAPITRAVPSFRVPMRLAVSVAWQKGN